jgi:hypothetical protein
MCQFKSFILLKEKIHYSLKTDSHSDLLEELNIKDESVFPNFVRVEVLPKDKDIFNLNIDNWKVCVDQDYLPDWFNLEEQSERILKVFPEIIEKQIIINEKGIIIKDQIAYCKNSSVVARENSSVVARENSSVVAWGNSSVVARENSSVEARENSSVVALENSSVVARENSSVVARENSSVVARGNSSVVALENSSVEARGNNSVVARGNSSVVAWGNSSVEAWGNSNILIPYSDSIKIKGVYNNATIKDLSKNPKIILANDFEIEKFNSK